MFREVYINPLFLKPKFLIPSIEKDLTDNNIRIHKKMFKKMMDLVVKKLTKAIEDDNYEAINVLSKVFIALLEENFNYDD